MDRSLQLQKRGEGPDPLQIHDIRDIYFLRQAVAFYSVTQKIGHILPGALLRGQKIIAAHRSLIYGQQTDPRMIGMLLPDIPV